MLNAAMSSHPLRALALLSSVAACACGNPFAALEAKAAAPPAETPGGSEPGQAVVPPFAVQGELDGLLLVWFDDKGPHTAKHRADVPEARRAEVRIDSLNVAPEKRLDPDHVYVADLRQPGASGGYAVHTYTRAWFDARVDAARPKPETQAALADTGVTIYKASWCGACKAAAAYLRSRNVRFVEKDIEKDAEAQAEMLRKAQAAGKRPSGVPVIDFRGHILLGFDQAALERLIQSAQPI